MKKILLVLILLGSVSFAQYSNLGSSGAQFLQIPIGARAVGMGGAVIGTIDDATSVFWNPAGLSRVANRDAQFSYSRWFEMFDINSAAVAYTMPDIGTFALSYISVSSGKMEITTEKQPNGTGRFFDANDMAIGLSYSRFLTDKFSVGVTAKYVYQRIWNETAEGIAFDIGTQYTLDFQNLTIAMSMSNFGSDLQFDGPDLNIVYLKDPANPLSRLAPARLQTDPYSLPLHFQVGAAIDIYRNNFMKVRGGIDVTHPNDNVERINLGTEIAFFDRMYLRGGYRFNYDDEKLNFGAGANLPLGNTLLTFDYSYSVYDILPKVQRISLGIRF